MDGTAAVIDAILSRYHRLDANALAAASLAFLRARVLGNVQTAALETYHLRDWRFKYVEETVTVLAGENEADLPVPWVNDGLQGLVYNETDQRRVRWARLGKITELQKNRFGAGPVDLYTVFNDQIRVFPTPQADTTLFLLYEGGLEDLQDTNPGGLDLIPARWIELVIYTRTAMLEAMDKGDLGNVPDYARRHEGGVFTMCCEERQGKPEARDLPGYVGGFGGEHDWWYSS